MPDATAGEFRLTVVIPTAARYTFLLQSVEALRADEDNDLEIIVVDSTIEKDPDAIAHLGRLNVRYVDLTALTSKRSMQVARNLGLVLANAPIVAFLDDDCFVRPGWAREILKPYQDPPVGAVGGRVVDRRWEFDTPREAVPGAVGVVTEGGHVVSGFFSVGESPIDVQHLPGGNASVRRHVALAVGGFDTGYKGTSFCEDTDFYYRVHLDGHRVLYAPRAEVYHVAATKAGHGFSDRRGFVVRAWETRNLARFLTQVAGMSRFRVLAKKASQLVRKAAADVVSTLATLASSLWGLFAGALVGSSRQRDDIAEARALGDRLRVEPDSHDDAGVTARAAVGGHR